MTLQKVLSVSLLVALLGLAACSGGAPSAVQDATKRPEQATITVGAMTIPDCATVYIAKAKRYFQHEGLTVDIKTIQSGVVALPQLQGGTLDFAIGNYVSTLSAQAKGAGPFVFVADAYEATPGIFQLMVPAKSKVKDLTEMRSTRIAVAGLNSISTLGAENALKTAGMSAKDVTLVPMGLPQMISAMETRQVDAAVLVEPFITEFATKYGGRMVADLMTGTMANFPIAGWMTTEKFAKTNPRTAAAFRRAMSSAQQGAATDDRVVHDALPAYTPISREVAAQIALGNFPLTLDRTRIQRVADLLREFGYIPGRLDVGAMLATSATGGAS
ncbi:ABC transporter substrate-binding protein [Sphaerisporangium sp. NPDC005289]|uniref:ABC transporter substrate-binding protein n=1 Tax=Sphaerisporangium sp. NPDC005289 TaxID=3155247 RepID=UPI0033ACC52B